MVDDTGGKGKQGIWFGHRHRLLGHQSKCEIMDLWPASPGIINMNDQNGYINPHFPMRNRPNVSISSLHSLEYFITQSHPVNQ